MASKTLLIILTLALIAVAYASYSTELQEEDDLSPSIEELQEYFNFRAMEKRGSKKFGECMKPNGKKCAMCNLKIKNMNDMRRYMSCSQGAANLRGI